MRRRRLSSVVAVGFLLVTPLIVACAWLHANDRWAAIGDIAMIELRVRDVGTAHTPLIGIYGRFGEGIENIGSHPGPLCFYLLAPLYRLLGGSYWALRVSTATITAVAIVCALLIANRRAGIAAVFVTGLGLVLLELGFGLRVLTEPWTPHVPVPWFVVFLLAVWSVAADDPWMLPVAAASASLCAQTHLTYLAVCGAIGLLVLLPFVIFWSQAARRGAGRTYARALLAAAIVVAVLWAPPIVDQLWGTGNLSVLVRFFASSQEPSIGIRAATPVLLRHLDAVHLVVRSFLDPARLTMLLDQQPPTPERGAVCLVLWAASAAVAVLWLRNRSLSALHGMVAVALVVYLFAISRILGPPWDYLTYGAWVVGACMLVATVATATIVAWQLIPGHVRPRTAAMAALAVVGIAACAGRLAMMDKTRVGSSLPMQSSQLAALAPMAADALFDRDEKAAAVRARYLVTWSETPHLAGQGRGFVNELERRGLDVGVPRQFGTMFTRHRVREANDATARIHLATGGWIDQARTIPGAVEIAYWDGRTPEARREFDEDRTAVADQLRRIGREDVAERIDRELDGCMVPGMPPLYSFITKRMAEIGVPVAVFVMPLPSS
jgi:hypothetical protein